MKKIEIVLNYDQATRVLQTNVMLSGFVVQLPDQNIAAMQTETTSLFASPIMTQSDTNALQTSISRALLTANAQLIGWKAAADNKAKADLLPASGTEPQPPAPCGNLPFDPTERFEETLNQP